MLNANRISIFLFIGFFGCSVYAENISKIDTFNFLKTKITRSFRDAGNSYENHVKHSLTYSSDICNITFLQVVKSSDGDTQYHYQTVDLSKIDPTEIKILYDYDVVLGVKKERHKVKRIIEYTPQNINTEYRNRLIFTAKNNKYAQKITKAFIHMTKLCGGQSELF